MKVLKVKVGSDAGKIYNCDAVEHDGKLWLVPNWLDHPDGTTSPSRMIRFDNRPHSKLPEGSKLGDYVINGPVPQVLLDVPTPKNPV